METVEFLSQVDIFRNLQESGLLVTFYRQFVRDYEKDPSGYKTLQSVLKVKDMDAFQKKWEKYVSGLRYP